MNLYGFFYTHLPTITLHIMLPFILNSVKRMCLYIHAYITLHTYACGTTNTTNRFSWFLCCFLYCFQFSFVFVIFFYFFFFVMILRFGLEICFPRILSLSLNLGPFILWILHIKTLQFYFLFLIFLLENCWNFASFFFFVAVSTLIFA